MLSARDRFMLIGGVVGAVLGATVAWAYANAKEQKSPTAAGAGKQVRLKAGAPDYVRIAMSLLTVVRQVVELFKPA